MKKLAMKKNTNEGLLITFCGLDGCGKTTMIDRLNKEFVTNYTLFFTKEPTDNVRNSKIFRTYMDCENHNEYDYRSLSLLAASDRIQHVNKTVLPMLNNKSIVISDRYYYSCLANLRARGFEKDKWIYEISKYIIEPDIAFFLDVPVELAVSRVRSREEERERFIDMDLQYRLREEYIKICKKNNGILINSDGDESLCYEMIKNKVNKEIQRKWKL